MPLRQNHRQIGFLRAIVKFFESFLIEKIGIGFEILKMLLPSLKGIFSIESYKGKNLISEFLEILLRIFRSINRIRPSCSRDRGNKPIRSVSCNKILVFFEG